MHVGEDGLLFLCGDGWSFLKLEIRSQDMGNGILVIILEVSRTLLAIFRSSRLLVEEK